MQRYGWMPDPYNYTWIYQYTEQLLRGEIEEDRLAYDEITIHQQDQVTEILQIFLTRRQDVLQLIEAYGVPRTVSRALTRRIIRFVLDNAALVPGTLEQRVQALYRRFIAQDQQVPFILRLFRVPENVIQQYITRVIRVTLRNIVTIPTPPPPTPNIDRIVNAILVDFERQFPNFLGLTTIYRIPTVIARAIVRSIIRFTVLNLNRIPAVGTIQSRADAMLILLDAEQPELIEQMIRRGVPAGQAEAITRQIIIFTLRNVPLPR